MRTYAVIHLFVRRNGNAITMAEKFVSIWTEDLM